MKYLKISAVFLGVVLFVGCHEEPLPEPGEPGAPTLILPEVGTVFDSEPPMFVWSSDSLADRYTIRIYGSSFDFQHTLSDTTYEMSSSLFESMDTSNYYWYVATKADGELYWSDCRSFVVSGKPDEPVDIDLDTTYFPFGLGFEWRYEVVNSYLDKKTWEGWTKYDTVTFSVADSTYDSASWTWFFDIAHDGSSSAYSFQDVKNPVEILRSSAGCSTITAKGYYCVEYITIPLVPEERSYSGHCNTLTAKYLEDTLRLTTYYQDEIDGICLWPYDINHITWRLKGVGVVQQGYSANCNLEGYATYYYLLHFYNGQDTVYSASQ